MHRCTNAALVASVLATVFVNTVGAQQQAAASPALDPAMTAFFTGRWNCAGQFASGKPLAATMSITGELGGTWLELRHDDVPPGQYHALSTWGIDRPSGKFVALIHDISPSVRLFTSEGWKADSLVLASAPLLATPRYQERFIYRRESEHSFRMTWEVDRDGSGWKMGDFLVCRRVAQ